MALYQFATGDRITAARLNAEYNLLKGGNNPQANQLLEAWAKDGRDELSVLLPEGDLRSLEAYFKDKLGSALKKGVELKPLKNTKSGFRIVEKGGAAYYDFSAAAVADMLGAYLNSRLASAVAEAAK